jgi:hypothetical protein
VAVDMALRSWVVRRPMEIAGFFIMEVFVCECWTL